MRIKKKERKKLYIYKSNILYGPRSVVGVGTRAARIPIGVTTPERVKFATLYCINTVGDRESERQIERERQIKIERERE